MLPQKSTKKHKTFVLDTNILLHDPHAITNFACHDVVIPMTVLEELDTFKKNQDDIGHNSREATRYIDSIFPTKAAMDAGYDKPGGGKVRIGVASDPVNLMLNDKADARILGCALAVQRTSTNKTQVILVTKDVNLKVKARALGIRASDLKRDQEMTKAIAEQNATITVIKIKQADMESFCINKTIQIFPGYGCDWAGKAELKPAVAKPYTFVLLLSDCGKEVPAKHLINGHFRALLGPAQIHIKGGRSIKSRNMEQSFLIDALFDKDVSVITVFGIAGTGKTILAIAAGLCQVQGGAFDKLVITRAIVPMGREIGFLPGTSEEKMRPWVQPCYDALEYIYAKPKERETKFKDKPQRRDQKITSIKLQEKPQETLLREGKLEIEVLATIRGRSIPNVFFVVDELQNSNRLMTKTLVSRMSEGSKIILLGDPDQIDDPYLDKYSNGLVHVATKFEGEKLHAHVTLTKGERSELAELAANIL